MSSRSSKSNSPKTLPTHIAVGSVRKPHGVRGEVTVEILSDVDGRIAAGSRVDVVLESGSRRSTLISSVRGFAAGTVIVRFEGIEDREQAQELRGALLEVDRSRVPEAPEGSFYFFEIVGCLVEDEGAGELGRVAEIMDDGGGLILRVESESRSLLVPFVEAYLTRLDVAARHIKVDLPEGLIETCTFKS